MTKHPSKGAFKAASWILYAIEHVKLEDEWLTQLSDVEQRALDVFFELLAETKKYPSTSQITRRSGLKNKTYVMDLMMRLVGWGYIGSYVKGNKRVWCDRAEAERLKYITEKRDAKI